MRGSPELLTGDPSENFLKALPPSLLPRYAFLLTANLVPNRPFRPLGSEVALTYSEETISIQYRSVSSIRRSCNST
jgi:hypothetical protein